MNNRINQSKNDLLCFKYSTQHTVHIQLLPVNEANHSLQEAPESIKIVVRRVYKIIIFMMFLSFPQPLLLVAVIALVSLTPQHRAFNHCCDAFVQLEQPSLALLSSSSRRLSMSSSDSDSTTPTSDNTDNNNNPSTSASAIKSVTVLGGTGFVGSRVCKILSDKGINVRSISKSGTVPKWLSVAKKSTTTTATTTEDDDESTSTTTSTSTDINWISLDILNVSDEELDTAMGLPDAIISCIGVVGTDPQKLIDGNGIVNMKGFDSARRVNNKLKSIAYVSVSSEVKACQENGWPKLPDFMESYFKAKNMAEQSAQDGDNKSQQDVTIVSPTFIYGGDSFGLIPPRVNDVYGSIIDQLLSFILIEKVADILPPGLIKVALRPPVSVNAVANACVNGILLGGSTSNSGGNVNILDTAKDINEMAKQEPATGINDAIDWTIKTSTEVIKFVQEKVKELDEKQK